MSLCTEFDSLKAFGSLLYFPCIFVILFFQKNQRFIYSHAVSGVASKVETAAGCIVTYEIKRHCLCTDFIPVMVLVRGAVHCVQMSTLPIISQKGIKRIMRRGYAPMRSPLFRNSCVRHCCLPKKLESPG